MLYFIGLGLFSEDDLSVKALNALKSVDCVYAEFYTARLMGGDINNLMDEIDVDFIELKREDVEDNNIVIKEAMNKDIAFVTAGDSLMATTHADLYVEAKNRGIDTCVIHGSSIFSAAPVLVVFKVISLVKLQQFLFLMKDFSHIHHMMLLS